MKHTVREIGHDVRVDLTDQPLLKTATGRRRKAYGLRIRYGVRRDVARVDVTVEFCDSAELFPPVGEMPAWMREIVEAHRPADVDNPWPDRRTGMSGWPLPEPRRAEGACDNCGTPPSGWCVHCASCPDGCYGGHRSTEPCSAAPQL